MAKFKDSKGTEWNLTLNFGLIEDIKDSTGIDLDLLLLSPEKIADLFLSSPRKLVELMYVICLDQIVPNGLVIEVDGKKEPDARAFGKRFDRPTLDAAADAMIGAVVDFYPRSSAGRVMGEKLPGLLAKMDSQIAAKAAEIMKDQEASHNGVTN